MNPPRVLIVDDNAMNVQLASFVLSQADFLIESASGAREALRLIPLFRPHLILMDIQMPDMDGLTLTRLLKDDPATCQIVVVAFTAYAMKGDEAKFRAAGCDGYLHKPIEVSRFADDVRACLRTPGH